MNDGEWTCSTDEEHWSCFESFPTREEALEYALKVFAPEQNHEGHTVWTGQVKMVTAREVVQDVISAEQIEDDLGEWFYEHVGEDAADDIRLSPNQKDDLEALLVETLATWLVANNKAPTCFTLQHVKEHPYDPSTAEEP